MKKEKLITLATIVFMVTLTIIAAKPSSSEIKLSVGPAPTPSPRKKRPKTIQSPKPIQSPRTASSSAGSFKNAGGLEVETERSSKPKKPNNFQEISGIGQERVIIQTDEGQIRSTTDQSPIPTQSPNPKKPRNPGAGNQVEARQANGAASGAATLAPSSTQSPATTRSTTPCTKPSKVKSPKSTKGSTQVKNKNCQEFEAVAPSNPRENTPAQYNPKEVGIDKVVKEKVEKSPTSSGDQPELQINSTKNTRKVTKPKNQDIEVENDETHRTQDPKVREGGVNDSTVPTNRAPSGVLTHNFDKLDVRTVPSQTPAAKPAKRKVKKPRN